jgi:DNA-binding HxlR family transcriptional regulator
VHDDCLAYRRKLEGVARLMQGKWTLQILCAMRHQPVRLSQLKRLLPSASKKAIRAALRSLEERDMVLRRDMSSEVLHVEYEFTDDARRVIPLVLDKMAECADALSRMPPAAADDEEGRLHDASTDAANSQS